MIVEELTQVLGLEIDGEDDLNRFRGSIGGAVGKLGALVAASFAAAKAVSSLLDAAGDVTDASRFARSIDVGFESLQRLEFAAKQNGVEFGALRGALVGLRSAAQGAFAGLDAGAADSFARLGVDIRRANGELKTADELLLAISDRLASSEVPALDQSIAESLGLGPEFNLLLRLGSDGIRRLGDEAQATGAILGTEASRQAETYQKRVDALNTAVRALVFEVGTPLLDWLTSVADASLGFLRSEDGRLLGDVVARFASDLGELLGGPIELLGKLSDALERVGVSAKTQGIVALLAVGSRVVAALSPATKAIAAFLLAAEDLNAFLDGKDGTVIGRVLDANGFGPVSIADRISAFSKSGNVTDLHLFPGIGSSPSLPGTTAKRIVEAPVTVNVDARITGVQNADEVVRRVSELTADAIRDARDELDSRVLR